MKIICIGKKHESWVDTGIARYQKRLRPPFSPSWQLLPHSAKSGDEARREESLAILSKITPQDYVILLDETGQNIDSPTLAQKIEYSASRGKVILIIGGAYGVDECIKTRADFVWSLSRLVFPHMLVRLILIEQLYRAQEILRGGSYHHQ